MGQQEPRAAGGMQRETPPVSWSDPPALQTPKWIPTLGASRYWRFSPREPVVPPGGHTQLPAGHQLGTRVQQRAPRVRGAPGPGLGRQGRGVGACPGVGDLGGDPGFCSGLPAAVSAAPLQRWGRASSGSAFQVWVIADKVQGSQSLSRGTVCRRTGVQPLEPTGQGWDYGIGVSRAGHGAAVLAWGSEP